MTNFPKELEDIILAEYNNINDKLTGINFLEAFKFNVIPKISSLLESIPLLKNLNNNTKFIIEKDNKKLEAILIYNQEPSSEQKKEIQKSTLFVVIRGGLTININQNNFDKKYIKLNIYPLKGVCLPPNTRINLNSFKNSLFIEFLETEKNNNIENLEKDIISNI